MKQTGWVGLAIVVLVVLFAAMQNNAGGLIDEYDDNTHVAQRSGINLTSVNGVNVTSTDDAGNSRVNFGFSVNLTTGSDGDSSVTSTATGLEFIENGLSLVRGCSDAEILAWAESGDTWDCSTAASVLSDVATTTWGTGTNFTWTYDTPGTDTTQVFSDDSVVWTAGTFNVTSSAAGGQVSITPQATGAFASSQFDVTIGANNRGILGWAGGTTGLGLSGDGTITSFDFDDTFLFRNSLSPASDAAFIFVDNTSLPRFIIADSGTDNATYSALSFILAGPAVFNDNILNCSTWGFTNLDCDTSATGADLGVQDDAEILGTVFATGGLTCSNCIDATDFDATDFGSTTWGAGSGFTWTFDASGGTDPAITYSSGAINISTGALQENGIDVATISGTETLTNKTLTSPQVNTEIECQAACEIETLSGSLTLDPAADLVLSTGGDEVVDVKAGTGSGQTYDLFRFNDSLVFQGQDAATNAELILATEDADGTDPATIHIFGVGDPDSGSIANRERMVIGYNTTPFFYINVEGIGTGSIRGFRLREQGTAYFTKSPGGGVTIDADTNIASSSNLAVGDATGPGTGTQGITLGDGTALSSLAANTAGLYADDVAGTTELFAIDEAGNTTQLSPHPADFLENVNLDCAFPWAEHQRNAYLGKAVFVDWCGLILALETLTGQTFMFVEDIPAEERRNWYTDQLARQQARDLEISNALAERARLTKLANAALAENNDEIAANLFQERNSIEIPANYQIVDPPKWLSDRGVTGTP